MKVKHPSVFLSCWRCPRLPRRPVSHSSLPHISVTGESPPSLSKELTNSLAGVGDVSFDPDTQFPLDELKIDPLTLDGLHMLNDPDMVLADPATEDTFRMDRLWCCPRANTIRKREKNTLTCEWRGTKGRTNPIPCCMVFQLSDLVLDSVKPFERIRHQNGGKKGVQGMTSLSLQDRSLSAFC